MASRRVNSFIFWQLNIYWLFIFLIKINNRCKFLAIKPEIPQIEMLLKALTVSILTAIIVENLQKMIYNDT